LKGSILRIRHFCFIVAIFAFTISACDRQKTVCEDTDITYTENLEEFPTRGNDFSHNNGTVPLLVDINGKMTPVDRIVTGPVCNELWSGKVYIGCNIQIAAWDEAPRFFEACDFNVDPGAIIIVASHNNETFYRGCSCHTGEDFFE